MSTVTRRENKKVKCLLNPSLLSILKWPVNRYISDFLSYTLFNWFSFIQDLGTTLVDFYWSGNGEGRIAPLLNCRSCFHFIPGLEVDILCVFITTLR